MVVVSSDAMPFSGALGGLQARETVAGRPERVDFRAFPVEDPIKRSNEFLRLGDGDIQGRVSGRYLHGISGSEVVMSHGFCLTIIKQALKVVQCLIPELSRIFFHHESFHMAERSPPSFLG